MDDNILRQIFFDQNKNWERFKSKYGNRIRKIVEKEIEKFHHCGDPRNGFRLLVCEGCHRIRRVPYRCKSRFCTTCSCGETEEWGRIMAAEVIQVNHRHVVFTIAEGLRQVFARYRFLLKGFMDEAVRIVQEYFKKKYKVTPGIIAGLHTFGTRLNFNPHVHMLVTMGGMKESGEWKVYDFIPFTMLRKQWQTVVLKLIRRRLTEDQKRRVQPLLQTAYKANAEGFYVYAPKQKGVVQYQLQYIGRYMRRPAIGLNRIMEYDGERVRFSYKDKTSGEEKIETVSVEEFIGRLIQHIPDEQFKLIRHYGIYARRIKALSKKMISNWQKSVRKWIVAAKRLFRRKWSERIKEQTGKDPMVCPDCNCYYEYKGEVCPKDGELSIKYAKGSMARGCLERMIQNVTGNAKEEEKRREPNDSTPKYNQIYLFGM